MRVTDKPTVPGSISDRGGKDLRRSGEAFQVSAQVVSVQQKSKVASVFSTVPLASVLALQGDETEQPVEKRKRQARRGLMMVDGLERLKVSLLSGAISPRDLDYLEGLLVEKREQDLPSDVNDLLNAVDVRVAVELAKQGR